MLDNVEKEELLFNIAIIIFEIEKVYNKGGITALIYTYILYHLILLH